MGNLVAASELDGPELPEGAEHVWEWFCALSASRGCGSAGPNPITWSEIEAFSRVRGLRLSAWECDCLSALDGAALASNARVPK